MVRHVHKGHGPIGDILSVRELFGRSLNYKSTDDALILRRKKYMGMFDQVSLEELEQQVSQLPIHEQLTLIARVSERLSQTTQMTRPIQGHHFSQPQLEQEAPIPRGPLYPTCPQPPESLTRLTGLVAIGGDALAESEALYDAD